MKNALFATTALVALGFAGAASASEPLKASIGGYMNIGVGITDNNNGDDVIIMRDGEIHFKFKGSSDNGLTFDGRVEMEAFGAEDQIDENWARVSGSFGSIMIGGNDTAMNELSAGVFYGPGAVFGYYDEIQPSTLKTFNKSYGTDYLAIHYYTPNFNGFQAGFTYAPDGTSDGLDDGQFAVNDSADGSNVFSIGVNYTGEVQGVSLSLSGGYSDADGSDREAWSLGAEVGAAGFKLGVHYEDNASFKTTGVNDNGGSDLAVGLSYATGPWTATVGYAVLLDAPTNEDIQTAAGWVTYAIAPGVKGVAGLSYADSDASGEQYLGMAYLNLGF